MGIRLMVIPISALTACGLPVENKVLYETVTRSTISTKNNMRKANVQINLLINYVGKVYKTFLLIKVNMSLHAIFLVGTLMKQKMNFF